MKNIEIAILLTDNCLASSAHGMLDVFSCANLLALESEVSVRFRAFFISQYAAPVKAFNEVTIDVQKSLDDARSADVILVAPPMPSTLDAASIDAIIQKATPLATWLLEQHKRGAILASSCTGSFILAEAGLLNGKTCTTHWRAASAFRAKYPEAVLKEDELVTEDGAISCGGGGVSYVDLTLHLIRKFAGAELANRCAGVLVMEPGRDRQSPYAQLPSYREHSDELIENVQNYVDAHYWEKLEVSSLAQTFHVNERTLKRRFSGACGISVGGYVQQIRVEAAKDRLTTTSRSLQQIVVDVGYEDLSSFARMFKKKTGLTMGQYREKFTASVGLH